MSSRRQSELWAFLLRQKFNPEEALSETLRKVPLFSEISPTEMRRVKRVLHRRVYQPGEVIFREGEAGWGMYLIESGLVRISGTDRRQQEVEYALLTKNEFFGEFALIGSEPRSATALAVMQSVLHGFFRSDLDELVDRDPRLGCKILTGLANALSHRLEAMNDKLKLYQEGVMTAGPRSA
jgi:CRP-like cAMP-binding protein